MFSKIVKIFKQFNSRVKIPRKSNNSSVIQDIPIEKLIQQRIAALHSFLVGLGPFYWMTDVLDEVVAKSAPYSFSVILQNQIDKLKPLYSSEPIDTVIDSDYNKKRYRNLLYEGDSIIFAIVELTDKYAMEVHQGLDNFKDLRLTPFIDEGVIVRNNV